MNVIPPILISMVCYAWCAYGTARQGDYPHSLMWFAYTLANTGLLWYELSKGNS